MFNNIIKKDYLAFQEEVFGIMNSIANVFIEEIREEFDGVIQEARFKIVNRVRNGKLQRRKKVSTIKGYRMDPNGRMVRMSPQERMKRIRGQRKAKIKRKAKIARSLQRRKISIKKRATLGN